MHFYAKILSDEVLILRLEFEDFVSREIACHAVCRLDYKNKAMAVRKERATTKINPESS